MKRQYNMIILMVVMATMLSACDNNTKNGKGSTKATKETYDFVKEDTTTSAEQGDINNEDQQDGDIMNIENHPIPKAGIKKVGTSVEYEPCSTENGKMQFTVLSVETTKSYLGDGIGNEEKLTLTSSGIEADESGNIKNDYSYVWIKVKSENTGSVKCEWSTSTFSIMELKEDMTLCDECSPLVYMGHVDDGGTERDKFTLHYEIGDTKETYLGFVVPDKDLSKRLGYYITTNSSPTEPGEKSFFVDLELSTRKE